MYALGRVVLGSCFLVLVAGCESEAPQPKAALAPPFAPATVRQEPDVTPRELRPAQLQPQPQPASPLAAARPAAGATETTPKAVSTLPAISKPVSSSAPTRHKLVLQELIAGPAPASEPVAAKNSGAAGITTHRPAPDTAIHLASYKDIGWARRGWKILSAAYRELAPLTPLYVAVDLPGKGHMVRLYGTAAEGSGVNLSGICRQLQKAGAYCSLNPDG